MTKARGSVGTRERNRSRSVCGGKRRRVWVRRSGVALVTAVTSALLAAPAPAAAYDVEPVVAENIPTVAQHAARGGAVAIADVDCGTRCGDIWTQEHQPIPNQPTSKELHRELRSLRIRARVLPPLRLLGNLGLAYESFQLGRKIGNGINAKYLRIGLPEAIEHPALSAQRLRFRSAHDVIRPGRSGTNPWNGISYSYPDLEMPYDGWAWEHRRSTSPIWWEYFDDTDQPWCDTFDTPPSGPVGFDHTAAPIECTTDPYAPPKAVGESVTYTLPENELEALGPIEDYVDQPIESDESTIVNWPDKPQTRTQLEDRLRVGFDSGLVPRAEAFYAEQLDPRNHDQATNDDEVCQPSGGGSGDDPGLGRGAGDTGEEFRRRYEKVPDDVYPSAGYPATDAPGDGRAYLRWGETSPNVDNSDIEWRGWGYRKIKAKHGWGPADREATRVALLSPNPIASVRIPGRYEYHGPEYRGQANALCVRVVVVDYEKSEDLELRPGYEDLPPAGIVTSYGERVG